MFGMKHLYARVYFTRSPAVPGLNGVCGPSLSGAGMAFAGDPRYGPLAIPLRRARLASGRPCRRLSGGRMIEAAVLHLLRADKSADLAVHVKRRVRSPPRWDGGIHIVRLRSVNLHSACSLALRNRRGRG